MCVNIYIYNQVTAEPPPGVFHVGAKPRAGYFLRIRFGFTNLVRLLVAFGLSAARLGCFRGRAWRPLLALLTWLEQTCAIF